MATDRTRFSRRKFLKASGVTATVLGGTTTATARTPAVRSRKSALQGGRQVGTWCTSPQSPAPEGISREGFSEQTLRQIVRTSVGGDGLRIRFANTFRDEPVTLGPVTVAIRDEGATILPSSRREVTFGDRSAVIVPPRAKVYSDPVNLNVEPGQDLAVSTYVPEGSSGPTTWHRGAFTTSYIADGPHTGEIGDEAFTDTTESWFFLEAIDVVNPDATGAIVALGDSITDGFGSTVDANSTYPHHLARRINESDVRKSVLNAGIGGNEVVGSDPGGGKSVLARLDRDVLSQTGVTDVVFLEGLNDIGHAFEDPTTELTAERLIGGMKQVAGRVHARGARVFAGTLTPFKRYTYYSDRGEETRQQVNAWIRDTDVFDGVIDFDEAVRDPDDPQRLRPEYDSGDNIHPNDAGYEAMAETVDIGLFEST